MFVKVASKVNDEITPMFVKYNVKANTEVLYLVKDSPV
jgi:hypothetical protein